MMFAFIQRKSLSKPVGNVFDYAKHVSVTKALSSAALNITKFPFFHWLKKPGNMEQKLVVANFWYWEPCTGVNLMHNSCALNHVQM